VASACCNLLVEFLIHELLTYLTQSEGELEKSSFCVEGIRVLLASFCVASFLLLLPLLPLLHAVATAE